MAYFRCTTGGSGKGNTLVVTCADELAGATITCTNGTKTYTKTCPSTSPYEVTFYGLEAGTYTVSATVSGNTYITIVVIADHEAELGGFSWRTWVNLSENYTSSDFTDLDDLLSDETAIRELMTIHVCVDYLAGIATESADVETIIGNDLVAKWINLRDYALDTLYANEIIADYMDTTDKYGYGEWTIVAPRVTSASSAITEEGELSYTGTLNADVWNIFNGSIYPSDYVSPITVTYTLNNPTKVSHITYTWASTSSGAIISNVKMEVRSNSNWTTVRDKRFDTSGYNSFNDDVSVNSTIDAVRITLTTVTNYAGKIGNLRIYDVWGPKGNVPVMTSNTTPYGTASASTDRSGYEKYKAFDGDVSTFWWSTQYPSNSPYIEYDFVNPVCVRAIGIRDNNGASTVTIKGDNGDNTWSIVADDVPCDNSSNITLQTFENNTYYLKYRVYIKTVKSSSNNWAIYTLQFYGRELSVSVPKMATNTSPYGEAKCSHVASGYDAYKAFDGDDSTGWYYQSTTAGLNPTVEYDFVKPIEIAKIFAILATGSSRALTGKAKLQYYDISDNTWKDLTEELDYTSNGSYYYIDLPSSIHTDKVRYICITPPVYEGKYLYGYVFTLQFYGKDYSEREFEEGTTKKWLYDHGVELETLHQYPSNYSDFKPSSIVVNTAHNANGAIVETDSMLDFTPYSLMRAKVSGVENVTYNYSIIGYIATRDSLNLEGYTRASAQDMPNNIGLDISSINQNKYATLCAGTISGGFSVAEFSEWWLE